jgi:hypothetical protein
VARRNARVKLDCEVKRHIKAVSTIDARRDAIITLAHSKRL